jgi:hypothetical protein
MAHYAKLDENNIVIEINVVDNDQEEEAGEAGIIEWLLAGWDGADWKKTSYNTMANIHSGGGTPFRKNYAGSGYTFDVDRDAFIPPTPFPSWVLDEDTCQWEAPTPRPELSAEEEERGARYLWDEDTESWVLTEPPSDTE